MTSRAAIVSVIAACALAACGGHHNPAPDGPGACSAGVVSGMGVLQDFCPPSDPGPNAFLLTASGEYLALIGYRFPPVNAGDFALVDGWDISYTHVITTFDRVVLSDNPDAQCPGDQSNDGKPIAEVDGPWAIDLHTGGSLVGKEGPPEMSTPIAELRDQNLHDHDAFDSAKRYAFSFDIVAATASARNVNFDAADLPLYEDMIAKGCTTRLVGQAVWKGNLANPPCTQSTVPDQPACNTGSCPVGTTCVGAAGSKTCQPDFSQFPTTINFDYCLPAPTSYINAQNPENDPAAPCGTEEHQRGVHTVVNQSTVIQATFHIDHVLWESFVHDSPPHFDSYASRYAGLGQTVSSTFDDFKGFTSAPFFDHTGQPVPWRQCVGTNYMPPATSPNQMSFDTGTTGIPINPSATCTDARCVAIRDFYDYVLYNHSTFGHLNADGLAFVEHHYPSP